MTNSPSPSPLLLIPGHHYHHDSLCTECKYLFDMFVVKHFSILDRPLRENPKGAALNTCSR